MSTTIIDNEIWTDLIVNRREEHITMLKMLKDGELRLATSDILIRRFITSSKLSIHSKEVELLLKVIFNYAEIYKVKSRKQDLYKDYSDFLSVCQSCNLFIVNDYSKFSIFDGYRGINVIEFKTYINNYKQLTSNKINF